jgi:phosphoglycolate phosphatase
VLFDKDGTLLDFQATWGPWAASTIRRLSESPEELERAAAALGVDVQAGAIATHSVIIAGSPEEIVEVAGPAFPSLTAEEIWADLTSGAEAAVPVPVPGLRPCLERLAADGYPLAVVTNDFESLARQNLDQLEVAHLFGPVIGFDSGHQPKPAPAGCLAAAESLGVDPARCVMVGDSLHDLRAGRAAGMVVVGVLTGLAGRSELEPEADVVLDDITELPDWLDA